MFLLVFFVGCLGISLGERRLYHTYTGTVISNETYQYYENEGVAQFCVIDVEDCNPKEGRRVDGTCNNLNEPTKGARHTPGVRELPAEFCGVDRPQSECRALPPSRKVRTTLLADGRASSSQFTNLVPIFWITCSTDTGFPHDTGNYLAATSADCCSPQGPSLPRCAQVEIPEDDFVHRYSGVRCQNISVPLTFQNTGCLANGTTPARINGATPEIDLSILYGASDERLKTRLRAYRNGELKYEVSEDGKIWPPSIPAKDLPSPYCKYNVAPRETRCHDAGDVSINTLLGVNLAFTWFHRLHNLLTQQLARYNPSWDDNRLFDTARDINIAIFQQIVFYELMGLLMGYENLVRDGILSDSPLHRDVYDENVIPGLSVEYPYALRWVHNIQEANLHMIDSDGNLVGNVVHSDVIFRTGFLAVDNNIDKLTRGFINQPSAAPDHIVDPDLAEGLGYGKIQRNLDVLTNDHVRGRQFGLPPYVKYLNLCFGANVTSYDDLREFVDFEGIENLKNAYENVEDIELLAGLWMEKMVEGGHVPATFYCLVSKQLMRFMKMDRFLYERPNRPHAFNTAQLLEIRKWTVAKLLCTVGDGVTNIQPNAFLLPGPGNEIGPCDETTPTIDYSVFKYGGNKKNNKRRNRKRKHGH